MRRVVAAVTLLAALAVTMAAAGPAGAQVGERIRSFDVTIDLSIDGTFVVTEVISYDFGLTERHGILRDIPVRFDYEPDPKFERITELRDISVRTGPGTPGQLKVEGAGRYKRLRIGDPDRTITGVHTYTISYRVRGALNAFDDHDELYWNATGNEWAVPIDRATATVLAPGRITRIACFAGPTGSALSCEESFGGDGPQAEFGQRLLSSYEGLTIVVGLDKGTVGVPPPILDEKWSAARAFAATPGSVGLTLVVAVVVIAGLARLLGGGRDRRWVGSHVDVVFGNAAGHTEPVPLLDRPDDPVEYEPPDKLRPGQIGTLFDERAHPLDVTATIIDLAVRGYLRIEEIPKKGWFGKADWRLVRLREAEGLLRYEKKLFNGLFQSGDEVELSDLKHKFAERLRGVQDALYQDAVEAGWFPTRPDRVRIKWRVIGVLACVLAAAALIGLAAGTHLGLVGIPPLVGALVLTGAAGRMPHRTAKGWSALRRAAGFRRFIEESEKERARFAERANLFSEYLPYAIVFGATDKWARAFAGLDTEIARATGTWYVSSRPFDVGDFGDSMDSFAVTTSGTIVATAASSGRSGFGGGGSSGGGFGGGGGGSW